MLTDITIYVILRTVFELFLKTNRLCLVYYEVVALSIQSSGNQDVVSRVLVLRDVIGLTIIKKSEV